MKTSPALCPNRESGNALFHAVVFAVVLGIGCFSLLTVSSGRVRASHNRWDYNESYYHAENALSWGAQMIADATNSPVGTFSKSGGTVALPYMNNLSAGKNTAFQNAWVTVIAHTNGLADEFIVTASAKVGNRVRTVQASVQKNPASQVFDYEYFLNNWGWWWGSTITGQGGNRANWDFDFRGNPTVNGSVIASGAIESAGTKIDPLSGTAPINGLAGSNPVAYLHDGAPRLDMPNLKNMTYYQEKAIASAGKLYTGATVVVNAVHTNTLKPGLYLKGTAADPIKVVGPVVIPGDVVISGPITGTGTLYVGGNLYIAGDMTYVNGPDFSANPEIQSASTRDAWVQNSLTAGKDLVSFAVRENIFAGQVNSSAWKSACFDPSGYGLKNLGAEANLGADGIPGTPDDGVSYWNPDGGSTPTSAWFDADADGVIDVAYNYSSDVSMVSDRAAKIDGYPTSEGNPVDFNSLSSNDFNTLNGIFYSNHAVAMRPAKSNFLLNGSIICRDEAIIFSSTCKIVYDSRIHSRYSNDPNRYIDLGLPVAQKIRINSLAEVSPIEGFYNCNQ